MNKAEAYRLALAAAQDKQPESLYIPPVGRAGCRAVAHAADTGWLSLEDTDFSPAHAVTLAYWILATFQKEDA